MKAPTVNWIIEAVDPVHVCQVDPATVTEMITSTRVSALRVRS